MLRGTIPLSEAHETVQVLHLAMAVPYSSLHGGPK